MSRIGKKFIPLPAEVNYEIVGRTITFSGPKGTLKFNFRPEVEIEKIEGGLQVKASQDRLARAMQGTTRQIVADIITGVNRGWSKTLEVVGTGFRANIDSGKLVLSLGFSHKIEVKPPQDIAFSVAENKITVSGLDKALVGKVASEIRQLRSPDAYKGKGLRYQGEKIRLKPGKSAKIGAGSAAK
ncbi:MAG: 50S ribosomal protein L6 [bacterium]|nr:50S ribosomal protein L6 [bacterium]